LPGDVSVLLIEHDMDLVFSFATRMTVLVNGAVLTEGSPQEISSDQRVKAVYLGHGDEIRDAGPFASHAEGPGQRAVQIAGGDEARSHG
jgi:energy-coupling factor transporter ATP-binding protein EcfA2